MIGYTAQLYAQVGPKSSFQMNVRPRIIVPTAHPPPVARMSAVSDRWNDAPMAVDRTWPANEMITMRAPGRSISAKDLRLHQIVKRIAGRTMAYGSKGVSPLKTKLETNV